MREEMDDMLKMPMIRFKSDIMVEVDEAKEIIDLTKKLNDNYNKSVTLSAEHVELLLGILNGADLVSEEEES
jgi:hypothetical protein